MVKKIYKVKFGMARAWFTPELKENTRIRHFTNKKKAELFLDRVNKFNIKDKYLPEFNVVAWSDLIEERKENG